jgi:hypothetical protein
MPEKKPAPKLCAEDMPVVPPPSSLRVDLERKPVLYLPDGRVLVRRVGF